MKSYLKFLSRNKLYTAIEAVGLAVSLAFVILIGSYVVQQYRMAHENPAWDRIYAPGTDSFAGLSFWDKEEIDMSIPEVETVTRMSLMQSSAVEYAGRKWPGISTWGFEVDPEFFDIYSYIQWREGSVEMFKVKDAIVLSESMARRIAEGKDISTLVGETLKINDSSYQIAGVVQDFENSILPPVDVLANIASVPEASREKSFNSIGSYTTLCRVREGTDRAGFEAKLHDLILKNYEPVWGKQVEGWRSWRLDELFWTPGIAGNGCIKTGNRQLVRLLTVVVLLLLLSAVFNYVNLSLAQGGKRAKELAMRRLLGSEDHRRVRGLYGGLLRRGAAPGPLDGASVQQPPDHPRRLAVHRNGYETPVPDDARVYRCLCSGNPDSGHPLRHSSGLAGRPL